MATIDASSLKTQLLTIVTRARATGVFATSSVKERHQDSSENARGERVAGSLVSALDRKLEVFQKALSGFQWPKKDFPLRRARLVVKDPELANKVKAEVNHDGDITRFYKYFSKGFDKDAAHGLENKSYSMTLSLGGSSSTLSVTVDSDDTTWGDVLDKTKDAVNESSLPVQAEVITQRNAGQKVPGLVKTGTMLALSVDPAYVDQDLGIDKRQKLTQKLDFDATLVPTTDPTVETHQLKGYQTATPTSYQSDIFDPEATTTLSAGVHSLGYTYGDDSGVIDFTVEADDSWEETLGRIADAINSAQSDFRADVEEAVRPVYLDGQDYRGQGVQLAVRVESPKLGERLLLSEGAAEDSVVSLYDPSSGLPPEEAGNAYIASATGNGWTDGNVYTFDGFSNSWQETTSAANDIYYVEELGANYRYDGSAWAQAEDPTATLGVEETAHPGSDAHMVIDGEDKVSATGMFSVDSGRLNVALEDSFGETLPLRVTEAMEGMELRLKDVVDGYNGVQSLILKDQALWEKGFAGEFRGQVAARGQDLAWLGLQEIGGSGTLYVDGDAFWSALYQDPDRAKDLLWTDNGVTRGLIPAWQDTANLVRARGLENLLADEGRDKVADYPWRRDDENEKDSKLLDLLG
jgi:hypothetical protein